MLLSLTACGATDRFNALTCPDVQAYSKALQQKAALELCSQNVPTLAEFMKDYKVMRDQARACNGKKVEPPPAVQNPAPCAAILGDVVGSKQVSVRIKTKIPDQRAIVRSEIVH
jgi:hypothetical protein